MHNEVLEEWLERVPAEILERGRHLAEAGAVFDLQLEKEKITAMVEGNYHPHYRVKIGLAQGRIEGWECECPYDGVVCKHVVAVVLKAFDLKPSSKASRRKGKEEMALEVVGKLSAEELRSFLEDLVRRDRLVRDALLARFPFYADPGAKSPEAKYNAIFRKIAQGYMKRGFIEYYDAIEFGRNVENLLKGGERLLEEGNLDEAFVLARVVLRNWAKYLDKMDDSAGSTGIIIEGALDLMLSIYRAGKEDVFDFLLKAAREKTYREFDLHYEIAHYLMKMADSREKAKKVLRVLETLKYGQVEKAEILARFFPEQYEDFVWQEENLAHVWKFHLEKLRKEGKMEEALRYLDHVINSPSISGYGYLQVDLLEVKAEILEELGRLSEALKTYLQAFDLSKEKRFADSMRRIASPEEWKQISSHVRRNLNPEALLHFLTDEGDFEAALKLLEEAKAKKNLPASLDEVLELLKKFPEEYRTRALKATLEASVSHLEMPSTRGTYQSYLRALKPVLKWPEKEVLIDFLHSLLKMFPRRPALRDEIQKLLSRA